MIFVSCIMRYQTLKNILQSLNYCHSDSISIKIKAINSSDKQDKEGWGGRRGRGYPVL